MKKNNFIYKLYLKRIMDFVLALIAIILLIPILIIISILVKVNLGSPIIFKQNRPGLNEEIFTMYKFRTMTNEKDKKGNMLSDDKRITKFGKWLRSTSLDELPSLINILKGDMSLVGPRPLLIRYLPYYTEEERNRHSVRPGLTGLSQVNGRNLLEWDKRLELDMIYVNKISFIMDLRIIFLTIKKVVKRSDIVNGNEHVIENLDEERKKLKIEDEDISINR